MSIGESRTAKAGPGRPENALDTSLPIHRRKLAQSLRDLRVKCGEPSYKRIAELVHRSQSSLSEAASGRVIPTKDMTEAYVKGCLLYAGREEEIAAVTEKLEADRQEALAQDDAYKNSGGAVALADPPEMAGEPSPSAVDPKVAVLTDEPQRAERPELAAEPVKELVAAGAPEAGSAMAGDPLSQAAVSAVPVTIQVPPADDLAPEADLPRRGESLLTRRNALIGIAGVIAGAGGAVLYRGLSIGAASTPEPPLRITSSYLWYPEDDYLYAIAGPLSSDHERRVMQAARPDGWTWLIDRAGAVRFGDTDSPDGPQYTRIEMSLENVSAMSILVKSIKASVLRRASPLAGALAVAGAQGETEVVKIGFDLDSSNDVDACIIDRNYELGERYTDVDQILLQPAEIVPLRVMALTRHYYTEWSIEFSVEVDGRRMPVTAPREYGGRFQSTAFAGRYATVYEHDSTTWMVERIPGSEWNWGR